LGATALPALLPSTNRYGFRFLLGILAGIVAAACGNSGGSGAGLGDAAQDAAQADASETGADAGRGEGGPAGDVGTDAFVVGPHAALPQVPKNGGPVLAHPQLVTVSFAEAGDAGAPDGGLTASRVAAFGDWIVGSAWLSQVGQDYGVGLGTHVHVTLGPVPSESMTDDEVQALLAAHMQDGSLPSAASDGGAGDYLYELFFPVGTTVSAPSGLGGGDTCVPYGGDFLGGYHWQTTAPQVAYAVVPTCSSGALVESTAAIESEASHELIEASTDPFPETSLGWAITDQTSPWGFLDGEVADLCSPEQVEEAGFTVQRIWSNSAAASGTNPCVPAPEEPFYDATTIPSSVQSVLAGKKISFEVQGFSSAAVTPWSVMAFTSGGTFDPLPTLDRASLGNDQTATLTLTIPTSVVSQDYALVIVNSSRSLDDYSYWPVVVQVP
jgi:hypothetical protein